MYYSEFVDVYDKLFATTKRLEKEAILAEFIKTLAKKDESEWIYLLKGKIFPDYDEREFGISGQLTLKALAFAFGVPENKVTEMYRKVGDWGQIAEELADKKRQTTLFSSKLIVKKVFENLRKVVSIEGKGTVSRKIELIAELLGNASGREAKYIVRTLLQDLRIGVADALLRDSITDAFYHDDKKEMVSLVGEAYDLANDFAVVFEAAQKGKKELEKISIIPGKPINAMLAIKVEDIDEAFEVCGVPAAVEDKYDGFRVLIHKNKDKIWLFTRRLENVTKQFPDVVEAVKKYVKGESFILDSEVVGYDSKTKIYRPFEAISQRIKRKYDIEKIAGQLPVEVNVFDVLYYQGESFLKKEFKERRKLLEKIIKNEKWKLVSARQIITSSKEEAMRFYENALSRGEEGIMVKKLDAPYQQGRRVGYMVKLKPTVNDLDLVVIGAEYGSGKRGGMLTSYILGCRTEKDFVEVGKVSSGFKEKESEGVTYDQITELLKPLIIEEKGNVVRVSPKMVVSVTYQNIQKSPSYSSGYALRFPRISHYRPDRGIKDIATLKDIEKEFVRMQRKAEK